MVDVRSVPDEPPPGSRVRHRTHLPQALQELVRTREVVLSISERDIRARYKQAVLGSAWALINPLLLMVVFAFFERTVADIDTRGTPYSLFAFAGLLPWTMFSSALNLGGVSLLNNTSLLNKVRCPREVFPLASVCVAGFDALIGLGTFAGLLLLTGTMPEGTSFWVVLYLPIQLAFTVAVVLLISILVIYFRDIRHLIGPLLQVGLFLTPVAYGVDSFSDSSLPWYSLLNPLAAVIEGYRRAVLYGLGPDWSMVAPAAASAAALLVGAYYVFKRLEFGIADLA